MSKPPTDDREVYVVGDREFPIESEVIDPDETPVQIGGFYGRPIPISEFLDHVLEVLDDDVAISSSIALRQIEDEDGYIPEAQLIHRTIGPDTINWLHRNDLSIAFLADVTELGDPDRFSRMEMNGPLVWFAHHRPTEQLRDQA